jgi:hypothetical protein
MALTCPAQLGGVNLGFTEFIDCSTLNINYDKLGVATLSFTVVSINSQPTPANYLVQVYGGVTFTMIVNALEVSQIPGSLVYEHKYTTVGNGCRI